MSLAAVPLMFAGSRIVSLLVFATGRVVLVR